MSSLRNLIARRRPPAPVEPAEADPPQSAPDDVGHAAARPADTCESKHSRLVHDTPVPPEVPRWELETPMPTMGDEPPISTDTADDLVMQQGPVPAQTERRKVWDLEADVSAAMADVRNEPSSDAAQEAPIAPVLQEVRPEPEQSAFPGPAPAPAQGGRVKTRLLGFHANPAVEDVFSKESAPDAQQSVLFPVGWVVIVEGPGRGTCFSLAPGLSTLGRGSDQTIPIDFGDDSISRDTHASIAYDDEENKILIGHGGKSNLVRLNDKPLVSATELQHGDQFRIGKTTLRFVALCGDDFSWAGDAGDD